MFQHTAARRRLLIVRLADLKDYEVSTHSRPKAAAVALTRQTKIEYKFQHTAARRRLLNGRKQVQKLGMFQHTAARRRLPTRGRLEFKFKEVSTHSRPKAAA